MTTLGHRGSVKERVVKPGRKDRLLVIISTRLKSDREGGSSSSEHPVVEMTWRLRPVI